MPLTVNDVKNAKPGRLSDGNGLYLLVKPELAQDPNGNKVRTGKVASMSWVLRAQYRGNRQDFGLGGVTLTSIPSPLPIHKKRLLTLAEAREKARVGRELAKNGINPNAYWRAETEAELPPTFEEFARDYHKRVGKGWRNGKHGEQWIKTLEDYAFPKIGAIRIDAVDANAVERVLNPIWLSKPETARRVRQRIGAVLSDAVLKGKRASDLPTSRIMGDVKQPKGKNFAAMPYKALPEFMKKLRGADFSIGNRALQFLILTAARSGEVRFARWQEFDLEAAEWTIPAERMKAGEMHVRPLVPAAVEILKELREMFAPRDGDVAFPGLKGKPMSDATLAKVLRVNGGADFTVHGFRSTFRDWAAEHGFNNDWAEAALAHTVAGQEGKTVAAYKRTTYFEHRRDKLMPAWGAFILNDQSNVISLAEKRA